MSCKAMEGLDELFDYKNQLIKDLLNSTRVMSLLEDDGKPRKNPKELLYQRVFPYEYLPETVEESSVFLCCEVDIEGIFDKTFLHTLIYIWVFTHSSLLRLPEGGLRMDELSSEITKVLNGSRVYGLGALELHSAKRFSPVSGFQGRLLKFYTKDFNRPAPNKHPLPTNRKHL